MQAKNFNKKLIREKEVVRHASLVLIAAGAIVAVVLLVNLIALREHANTSTVQTNIVQSSQPKRPLEIEIPSLSITAPVVPLGLNSDGSLQVPPKDTEVGWFAGGTIPGETGSAIMVGHLDSAIGPAIFWDLKNLRIGNIIRVARADGGTTDFQVTKLQAYGFDNFPDQEVYGATSYPSLRLLTCSGIYNKKAHHYSENLVVFADKKQ